MGPTALGQLTIFYRELVHVQDNTSKHLKCAYFIVAICDWGEKGPTKMSKYRDKHDINCAHKRANGETYKSPRRL